MGNGPKGPMTWNEIRQICMCPDNKYAHISNTFRKSTEKISTLEGSKRYAVAIETGHKSAGYMTLVISAYGYHKNYALNRRLLPPNGCCCSHMQVNIKAEKCLKNSLG